MPLEITQETERENVELTKRQKELQDSQEERSVQAAFLTEMTFTNLNSVLPKKS